MLPFFITGCGLKKPVKSQTSPKPFESAGKTGSTQARVVSENSYLGIEASTVERAMAESLAKAEEKAKLWKADAAIIHYSVRFVPELTVGAITETFSYGSPAQAFDWWTITIAGKTGKAVRAVIPKEDYLGTSYTAIPRTYWKSNYVDALQLADTHGGFEYRTKYPDSEIAATLAVGEPKGYLWWSVDYRSPIADPLVILINASTKEVFDSAGTPLSKPTTTSTPQGDEVASPVAEL